MIQFVTTVDVTRWIQLIVAPVVLVTACAILLRGLLGHYAAVNDRLRLLARERLDVLRDQAHPVCGDDKAGQPYLRERLAEIDQQVPELLSRHLLIRDAILTIYISILMFLATMFAIAVAVATNARLAATITLLLFLIGTAFLFIGIGLVAWEIRISHRAMHHEVHRVMGLTAKDFEDG